MRATEHVFFRFCAISSADAAVTPPHSPFCSDRSRIMLQQLRRCAWPFASSRQEVATAPPPSKSNENPRCPSNRAS